MPGQGWVVNLNVFQEETKGLKGNGLFKQKVFYQLPRQSWIKLFHNERLITLTLALGRLYRPLLLGRKGNLDHFSHTFGQILDNRLNVLVHVMDNHHFTRMIDGQETLDRVIGGGVLIIQFLIFIDMNLARINVHGRNAKQESRRGPFRLVYPYTTDMVRQTNIFL